MEVLMKAVNRGQKVRISLEEKIIYIGKKKIDPNSIILPEMELTNVWSELERLYRVFKYSRPSTRTNRSYFKALPLDDLSLTDMIQSIPREQARVELETFVLIHGLKGDFTFDNDNHWFWFSPNDNDLVLLKQWVM